MFTLPASWGSLAQSVEQRTFNPLVPRSSRGRPILFYDERCVIVAKFDFERAVEEIEKINERLDSAQTSLEDSIELFKRGSKLLLQCQRQLDKYERQVKILTDEGLQEFNETYDCSK